MDSLLLRNCMTREVYSNEWLSIGQHEKVLNSDHTYWEICRTLNGCGMTVQHIHRILHSDSSETLRIFNTEKEKIQNKNKHTSSGANVQDLYYGGSRESLISFCQEGLDHRTELNKKYSYFGKAIYFSDSPERCRVAAEEVTVNNHSAPQSSIYYVLRCKVILGDIKEYGDNEMDTSLSREPVKDKNPTYGTFVYYDSVKGRPTGNYTEYMVYEKTRVLVEYVIEYTCDKPLPQLPSAKKSKSVKSAKEAVPADLSPASRERKLFENTLQRSSSSCSIGSINDTDYEDQFKRDDNDGSNAVSMYMYSQDGSEGSAVTMSQQSYPEYSYASTSAAAAATAACAINTTAASKLPAAASFSAHQSIAEITTAAAAAAPTFISAAEGKEVPLDDAFQGLIAELVTKFRDFTSADEEVARKYLASHELDVQRAVDRYFNDRYH